MNNLRAHLMKKVSKFGFCVITSIEIEIGAIRHG